MKSQIYEEGASALDSLVPIMESLLTLMTRSFLAIDFETANPYRDSACAIGLVRVERGKIVQKAVHLIQPPYRHFMFTSIHGISWSDVDSAPTFKEVWKKVSPLFDGVDFVAAHNASFDSSVLRACCLSSQITAPDLPFACTVKLARSLWNIYPTKLPDVARHLGIQLNHHEALSDALACAQVIMAAQSENAEIILTAPKTARKPRQKPQAAGADFAHRSS